jgi:predicted AAA+ superfamily ATPase
MGMAKYKERLIDDVIKRKLQASGGVVIKGPRASGKTTTALHHAASSIRLDQNMNLIEAAKIAPETILAGATPRLIDEWQLAPSIWNSVRAEIDVRKKPGQFILTGSSAPAEDKTRHTGAGRFSRLSLRPMTLTEMGLSTNQVSFGNLFESNESVSGLDGLTIPEYANSIVKGGWPALQNLSPRAAMDALTDYVDNIADVDLRTIESPPDPIRVAALIRAISRNIATEASLDKLAAEAEIEKGDLARPTVRKYLDQLTRIFVLEELPAWSTHLRSSIRLRVKPKWHFVDPSLATAALGASPSSLLHDLNAMGLLFESMTIRDIRVFSDAIGAKVFHYRDSTDLEIDAIVERRDEKWIGVEVKLGGEEKISEAVSNFEKLRKRLTDSKLKKLASLNIITGGAVSYTRPDGINIISLGHLCL